MPSLFEKLLAGSSYMNNLQYGRASNSLVLRVQEPVGYAFFSSANMNALLDAVRLSHPQVEMADITDTLLQTFLAYGTQRAAYYDYRNAEQVARGRDSLNRRALLEINRHLGNVSGLHSQYDKVLQRPNRLAATPQNGKLFSREQETPYHRDR